MLVTKQSTVKSAGLFFPGAFPVVLEFIQRAKDKLETEVTAVTTPEVDLHKVKDLARDLGAKFRLRQCIPCFW